MSCLISIVWDQSACQECAESDKIQNHKFLPKVGLEPTTFEMCSLMIYQLSYPGFDKCRPIKLTFIRTCAFDINVYIGIKGTRTYEFENDGVDRILFCTYSVLCYILIEIHVYLFWTNSKETHNSCVCFQHAKHDQTLYLSR